MKIYNIKTILKRYVSDRELFEKLVEESLKLKTTRTAIGGNAPVIANRMAREGAQVQGLQSRRISDTIFVLTVL